MRRQDLAGREGRGLPWWAPLFSTLALTTCNKRSNSENLARADGEKGRGGGGWRSKQDSWKVVEKPLGGCGHWDCVPPPPTPTHSVPSTSHPQAPMDFFHLFRNAVEWGRAWGEDWPWALCKCEKWVGAATTRHGPPCNLPPAQDPCVIAHHHQNAILHMLVAATLHHGRVQQGYAGLQPHRGAGRQVNCHALGWGMYSKSWLRLPSWGCSY